MKVTHNGWHFTRLLNAPLEDENLTMAQKMVFVALSYFMDKDGKGAHPSYQTIAKIAGCSRRTAIDAISELVDKKYIKKVYRKDASGDQATNDYIVNSALGSETVAPPPVQELHPGSAGAAPKLEPSNENQLNESNSAGDEHPPARKPSSKNSRGKSKSKRSEADIELYHAIEQAFLSQNDDQFPDYGKEGRSIWKLVDRAKKRDPENAEHFASQMLETFWRLKKSRDKFWSGQPFLASVLNSSGIWDRVLEEWRGRKPAAVDAGEIEELARMF